MQMKWVPHDAQNTCDKKIVIYLSCKSLLFTWFLFIIKEHTGFYEILRVQFLSRTVWIGYQIKNIRQWFIPNN